MSVPCRSSQVFDRITVHLFTESTYDMKKKTVCSIDRTDRENVKRATIFLNIHQH